MKKKIFLLCMVLTGLLAGCAAWGEDDGGAESSPASTQEAAVVERTVLEADLGKMEHIQLAGDVCYYVRYDKLPDSGRIVWYLCRQKGEDPEEITAVYGEDGVDYYLMCGRVDAVGNWYLVYERDAQEETGIFLEKLDGQGERLYCVQAAQFADTLLQERVRDGVAGPGGEFCALTGKGTVLLWDGQGRELWKAGPEAEESDGMAAGPDAEESGGMAAGPEAEESDKMAAGLVSAGEAGIYLYYDTLEGNVVFQSVDSGQGTLGQKVTVELQSASREETTHPTDSSYTRGQIRVYGTYGEFCYLSAEDGLWRYSFNEGKLEYMFGWSDPYVSMERRQVEQIAEKDGRLTFLCYDDVLKSSRRVKLEWRRPEELAGKTLITLGCDTYAAENLTDAAKRYNAQSDQYLVEVRTYDLVDSGEELDEMTLALLQGKGPDLFDFSFSIAISMGYYVSRGILEDLTPYLARSGIRLVEPVAEALEIDGCLYALGESFFLKGMVCQQGYAGDGGLSIRQCGEMAAAYPDACFKKKTGRALALDLLLSADMASYLDLEEGTCRFDSGEFIGLLDMVNSWKEPVSEGPGGLFATPDELRQKKYLVEEVSFMNMVDYLAVRNAVKEFGQVAGYPNSAGEAMYQVCFQNLYGMNSASGNKEGAWDFLEYLISEENQKRITTYFPITEEGFHAALWKGQEENEASFNLFTMERETGLVPTEQDVGELREIAGHVYYPDHQQSVISGIIREEAGAVFDGSKTSKQAAETIQNRVSLFLAE